MERCVQTPPLAEDAPGHAVACWLAEATQRAAERTEEAAAS
jgi:hypothetical protein